MTSAVKTVQIVKTPGVRGGKARIEGTRVCVLDVAYEHRSGLTPEQIQVQYPDLNLAQIHAALSQPGVAGTIKVGAKTSLL